MNEVGDYAAKAVLLSDLGLVARETAQFDQAFQYYQESIVLMRRVGNQAGQADVYRMMARLYLAQCRYHEALACTQTSLAMAERLHDELRMGGAWYVMASCYEAKGELGETIRFLEHVVRIDQRYQLPKLQENTKRLRTLQERVAKTQRVKCE